jgi:hypothetical protein
MAIFVLYAELHITQTGDRIHSPKWINPLAIYQRVYQRYPMEKESRIKLYIKADRSAAWIVNRRESFDLSLTGTKTITSSIS